MTKPIPLHLLHQFRQRFSAFFLGASVRLDVPMDAITALDRATQDNPDDPILRAGVTFFTDFYEAFDPGRHSLLDALRLQLGIIVDAPSGWSHPLAARLQGPVDIVWMGEHPASDEDIAADEQEYYLALLPGLDRLRTRIADGERYPDVLEGDDINDEILTNFSSFMADMAEAMHNELEGEDLDEFDNLVTDSYESLADSGFPFESDDLVQDEALVEAAIAWQAEIWWEGATEMEKRLAHEINQATDASSSESDIDEAFIPRFIEGELWTAWIGRYIDYAHEMALDGEGSMEGFADRTPESVIASIRPFQNMLAHFNQRISMEDVLGDELYQGIPPTFIDDMRGYWSNQIAIFVAHLDAQTREAFESDVQAAAERIRTEGEPFGRRIADDEDLLHEAQWTTFLNRQLMVDWFTDPEARQFGQIPTIYTSAIDMQMAMHYVEARQSLLEQIDLARTMAARPPEEDSDKTLARLCKLYHDLSADPERPMAISQLAALTPQGFTMLQDWLFELIRLSARKNRDHDDGLFDTIYHENASFLRSAQPIEAEEESVIESALIIASHFQESVTRAIYTTPFEEVPMLKLLEPFVRGNPDLEGVLRRMQSDPTATARLHMSHTLLNLLPELIGYLQLGQDFSKDDANWLYPTWKQITQELQQEDWFQKIEGLFKNRFVITLIQALKEAPFRDEHLRDGVVMPSAMAEILSQMDFPGTPSRAIAIDITPILKAKMAIKKSGDRNGGGNSAPPTTPGSSMPPAGGGTPPGFLNAPQTQIEDAFAANAMTSLVYAGIEINDALTMGDAFPQIPIDMGMMGAAVMLPAAIAF